MWSLLGIFIVVTLYALGVRTLVPPDEGRYAEMAREMFATGDWITTRLNGIKYFEKPPLQTWMNALTFAAFGLGEWQARLWTGLCGIIGVCMTAYAGKKVFGPRVGLYAGLVLASSLFWLASGQINSLDMGLSGMMTLTLCSLLIAQRDDATAPERRNWMLVCWAAMALAVLAKGLIGIVLPGAVLVLYSLCARDWRIWTRLHLVKGLLLFFAIATPWFVLVALRNPEQPHFFFIHEHFQRFLMKGHKREGAWYYFLVLLIPGILPWIGVLPQSLAAAFKRQEGAFQPRLMLLVWAVFIFFFFSYSTSKLPGYIVPIFPALALAGGAVPGIGIAPPAPVRRRPAVRAGRGHPDRRTDRLQQGQRARRGCPGRAQGLPAMADGGRLLRPGRRRPGLAACAPVAPRHDGADDCRRRLPGHALHPGRLRTVWPEPRGHRHAAADPGRTDGRYQALFGRHL